MRFKKNHLFILIPVILLLLLFFMPNRQVKEDIIYNTFYEEKDIITVYVFGEVKTPGTYYLADDATLATLIKQCELTDKSTLAGQNLNVLLIDNTSYEVLSKEEGNKVEQSELVPKPSTSKININTANLEELISLSGIGSVKANAIISYRKEHKFLSIEDLKKVDGISDTLYDTLKDFITV